MSVLVFVFLILAIFGKTKRDNRRSPVFGFGMGIIVFLMILSVFLPWLLAIGGAGLLGFIIYKIVKKVQSDNRTKAYGWDASKVNQQGSYRQYTANTTAKTTLPKAIQKRKKIVDVFNTKFHLYLTPEQVNSIVNSSYMSEIWRKELEAMDKKYESVYEWFQGYTKWLRVYLYAFHVQEVTSDIRQQENVCIYAFEEVFKYVDTLHGMTLAEKIAHVNDKFYASFDDISFMIAYRYLEEKGKKHDLSGADIIRDDEEIDNLLKKYEQMKEEEQGTVSQQ